MKLLALIAVITGLNIVNASTPMPEMNDPRIIQLIEVGMQIENQLTTELTNDINAEFEKNPSAFETINFNDIKTKYVQTKTIATMNDKYSKIDISFIGLTADQINSTGTDHMAEIIMNKILLNPAMMGQVKELNLTNHWLQINSQNDLDKCVVSIKEMKNLEKVILGFTHDDMNSLTISLQDPKSPANKPIFIDHNVSVSASSINAMDLIIISTELSKLDSFQELVIPSNLDDKMYGANFVDNLKKTLNNKKLTLV
jgi:hypothetical protein